MIPNFKYEEELYKKGYKLICGMDEVGRGSWAGPLVLGAVILRRDKKPYRIRDSKALNEAKREKIYPTILNYSLDYSTGAVLAKEIDKLGLSRALKLAAKRTLKNLKIQPDVVLLDGKWNFIEEDIKVKTIIKGDSKSISIASASIVAKVTRDRLLAIIHQRYPAYNFLKNKGYGTKEHQKAIKKHGLCKAHRKSYRILKNEKQNRPRGRKSSSQTS